MIPVTYCCHAIVCAYLVICLLLPISLYANENNLEKAQEKTVADIAELESNRQNLKEESLKCNEKRKRWEEQLISAEKVYEALQTAKRQKAKWQFQLDNAKRTPDFSEKQIREYEEKVRYYANLEAHAKHEVSFGAALGLYNEGQWEALNRLNEHCWQLANQWEEAKVELEQLKRRAENLKDFECSNLLGEFKAEASSDNPSAAGIASVLQRGKDCPWYQNVITSLLDYKHREEVEVSQGHDNKQEPTPEPPPSPPVDDEVAEPDSAPEPPPKPPADEEVVEDDPDDEEEYFEDLGESDSAPEPPPKPPADEEVVEDDPDDDNEYFEELAESEVGSTANEQTGNLCSTLLAQFNATYNIEQMRAILQQAQNCSWYGAGVAALQNQIDFYNEQYGRQEYQPINPGTVNVVPNPFPNPYATPPQPWKPNQLPGRNGWTRYDYEKAAADSRANPPPRNVKPSSAGNKPSKPAPKPPQGTKKPSENQRTGDLENPLEKWKRESQRIDDEFNRKYGEGTFK